MPPPPDSALLLITPNVNNAQLNNYERLRERERHREKGIYNDDSIASMRQLSIHGYDFSYLTGHSLV